MSEEMVNEVVDEGGEQQQPTPGDTGENAAGEPKDAMIPKARLDAEIAKRKELQAKAAELDALKKAQADAEAEKAGAIEKFKTERDEYEAEAKQWRSYATTKLDELTERLDDAGKAVMADLEDAPLAKRLSVAEKLAAVKKTEEPQGFGSGGGKAAGGNAGLIPPTVGSLSEFHQWMANLQNDAEGRALLMDRDKMSRVRAEAAKRFR